MILPHPYPRPDNPTETFDASGSASACAIESFLSTATPVLKYLAARDVMNMGDIVEMANGPAVVGYVMGAHGPYLKPGQPVDQWDVDNFRPRRYSV